MTEGTTRSTIMLIILVAFPIVIAGLGFLQSKLVRKENEAIGLILPTVFFTASVLILLLLGMVNNETTDSFAVYIGSLSIWFIILNIPTIVFTIIYSVCRKNDKAKKEIEKMNIMDLE